MIDPWMFAGRLGVDKRAFTCWLGALLRVRPPRSLTTSSNTPLAVTLAVSLASSFCWGVASRSCGMRIPSAVVVVPVEQLHLLLLAVFRRCLLSVGLDEFAYGLGGHRVPAAVTETDLKLPGLPAVLELNPGAAQIHGLEGKRVGQKRPGRSFRRLLCAGRGDSGGCGGPASRSGGTSKVVGVSVTASAVD